MYQSEPIDLSDALIWLDNHPEDAAVNKNVSHKQLNIELKEKRSLWAEMPKAGVYRWGEEMVIRHLASPSLVTGLRRHWSLRKFVL
ncbi:MAG: hypothetical protein U9N86_14490 [Bacteroidota bacterium]|nr:hypothetical protein [Bacteroidota bacterium]